MLLARTACETNEEKQGLIRTDNQNFVVCKKQLSSWNCFYGLGLSKHRQFRNFWAKAESTQRGRLRAFIQKTPTDDHQMTVCKR